MTLAVLGLVFPNFTTSKSGPNFSTEQEIFLIVVSLLLYGIFLLIQTVRHRRYFMESEDVVVPVNSAHHPLQVRSTAFQATVLLVYLITVILLSEKFAIPLDNGIEKFHMPQALGGAIIAALVLSPEGLGANPRQLEQSPAAFNKPSAWFRARHNWTNDSCRADDWTDHEPTCHTRRGRR
jgi:Ca2+:H+ antiporter